MRKTCTEPIIGSTGQTLTSRCIDDDKQPFCPKEGLLVPKTELHIAFGDTYCMACKDMPTPIKTQGEKVMFEDIPNLLFHQTALYPPIYDGEVKARNSNPQTSISQDVSSRTL